MRPVTIWLATALMCLGLRTANSAEDPAARAAAILNETGVRGGMIVHIGCADGRLTAALHLNDSFTIHGLESDVAKVEKAREHVRDLGLYGPVSIEGFQGTLLPYADNLINLVVAENPGDLSLEEITRVLVPNGVAYVRHEGNWVKTVKPWSHGLDDWSHFLHDAGNNAVADDTVVGPPRALQWVAPPLWLRSHETPSGFQAQVSANGRVFYILDEGLIGIMDPRLPERWSIVCRDACNGKLLWRRPIEPWGWREWAIDHFEGKDWTVVRAGRVALPDSNQWRLVAQGERLYATLGFHAPVSVLDAATGEVVSTVEGSEGASEIRASDGVALACVSGGPSETERRRGETGKGLSEFIAADGASGAVLWRKTVPAALETLLAVDQQRVFYQSDQELMCLGLHDGKDMWRVEPEQKNATTLVANSGHVLLTGGDWLEVRDGETGGLLWRRTVLKDQGFAKADLFITNGWVWTGMCPVNKDLEPVRKDSNVLAVALDLQTGEEKKRIFAADLRSPEHHHRCYRNKATTRYLISGMEGAEFLDLQSDEHSQNNWVRGACKLGIMPCNGMLYVPPDQCFCQPGAKLLGYCAVGPEPTRRRSEVPDAERLVEGPAYGAAAKAPAGAPREGDWPTFRHDPARTGATESVIPTPLSKVWKADLGEPLTAPVSANARVFVAARDAHTIHALDAKTGAPLWSYTAGGRIDSPPTLHDGNALFGSADGYVYCVRQSDGVLVWRFMAAPSERRIGYMGQIESAWPVHGSVLVANDTVYFGAGRSTYLDGGIRLYGLNPATGAIRHKALLEGPRPEATGERDRAFYLPGANSDVLVAQGGFIYMRQKRMTLDLEAVTPEVLSSKGEMDVGLHLFSTAGLLDGSWYNRTFWMYSKRWPGFQLANQAPKAGQLLAVGPKATYGVKVFYRRNVHTTMFFPGKEGYLIFADENGNEPQIVGEEGARPPVHWLPQSDYAWGRGKKIVNLDALAFGQDKGIGYTRAEPPLWTQWLPVRVRAMAKAGDVLFMAGPPDVLDETDPYAAFEGRRGARLVALSTHDGLNLLELSLDSPPVFDGLIAVEGCLFLSLENGSLVCLSG